MNSETVNPIPASTDTEARLAHEVPSGIRAILSLMAAHDMRNIPRNLPATRPRIIARLTPLTTMPGVMSPKKIPALAKAKRGIIR